MFFISNCAEYIHSTFGVVPITYFFQVATFVIGVVDPIKYSDFFEWSKIWYLRIVIPATLIHTFPSLFHFTPKNSPLIRYNSVCPNEYVGLMTYLGLFMKGAPYAGVFCLFSWLVELFAKVASPSICLYSSLIGVFLAVIVDHFNLYVCCAVAFLYLCIYGIVNRKLSVFHQLGNIAYGLCFLIPCVKAQSFVALFVLFAFKYIAKYA